MVKIWDKARAGLKLDKGGMYSAHRHDHRLDARPTMSSVCREIPLGFVLSVSNHGSAGHVRLMLNCL